MYPMNENTAVAKFRALGGLHSINLKNAVREVLTVLRDARYF